VVQDEFAVVTPGRVDDVEFLGQPVLAVHRPRGLVAGQRHDDAPVVAERPPRKCIADGLELPPDAFEDLGFQRPRVRV
jgi:hypothetical protein